MNGIQDVAISGTVNPRISAQGAYLIFQRERGAFFSFINFWPQNDTIFISS